MMSHAQCVRPSVRRALGTSLTLFVLFANVSLAAPIVLGKVVGVVDGDTLTLLDEADRQRRIRLAGIDAPERGQAFGQASKRHLSHLAFGRIAAAECHKLDRYGRFVCVVRVDGVDVSLAQVKAGLAWHYKKYAHEQTEVERETYSEAEEQAREARRGLWSDPKPIPPWEWRRSSAFK
jgi:endonuclease YncB( thermonuclease family)